MPDLISARAPGKILWIGGYSILERPNISFATAVDAYVTASLKPEPGYGVKLSAPQLGMSMAGTVDESTGAVKGEPAKELLLFKTAAEVALRYAASIGMRVSGFSVTTSSDGPFAYSLSSGKIVKSGLGSSSAVTVAVVASVLKALDVNIEENDALHKLAQAAHSIATGRVGSGYDTATATYGSIFYTRYSPDILKDLPADYANEQLAELVKRRWDYKIEKFSLPSSLRLLFANFGESMITTQAVGSVNEFKKKDPGTYSGLIKEINDENVRAADALRKLRGGDDSALEAFREAFDKGRLLTKTLGELSNVGIEPDDLTELIEGSKKNGAFVAKLPGAGGRDAIAALSLDEESRSMLNGFWSGRNDLRILGVSISGKGMEFG